MTISVGTPSTDQDEGVSSVTFSHTVTAGKGRQLLVGCSFNNDNFEEITGVTYDGNALSLVIAHDRDDDSRAEFWRLADPPVGTADVVITLDGTLTSNAGIISGATQFDEVDTTTPVGATASDDGDSATNSVTVASNTGELCVEVSAMEQGSFDTIGAGQTELWNLQAGSGAKIEDGASSYKAGASPNVTLEWDNDDDKWVMLGISLRPSTVPVVDAGGPYSGDVSTAIPLNATVTPGTDPSPTFLWTIDSGPGSGVFTPSATVEDPSFTPDTVGAYTLRLTVTTVDAPDVFDTASLDSQAVATPPTVDAGGPYNGDVDTATALNATVTPGTDPTPVLTWTIDSGPGSGVFLPSANVEDPTFTPDTVGSYVLKLEANPSDGPPVSDTAAFESDDIPPVVEAGGPYSGVHNQPTFLAAFIIAGSDPSPALLWTIDSGPGGGVFLPSAAVEDPTFTPDSLGTYTLRLTATPSDGPPVFDTATFESTDVPVSMGQYLGGRFISDTGDLVLIELPVGTDPPAGDVVYLAGMARSHEGPIYAAIDDGIVPRVIVNGQPLQHNGVLLVNEADNPNVNLGGWAFVQQPMARSINQNAAQPLDPFIKGAATDPLGAVRTAPFLPPGPQPPVAGNLQFWWDFTDIDVLFQDVAGTIPVTANGQSVLRVNNKGNDPVRRELKQPGPAPGQEYLYFTPEINGLSAILSPPGALPLTTLGDNTNGTQSGIGGLTMAVVMRRRNDTLANGGVNWGNVKARIDPGAFTPGFWDSTADGFTGTLASTKPVITGEWVCAILNLSPGSNIYDVSGAPPVSNTDPYIQIAGFGNFYILDATRPNDYAEALVWDKPLSPTEIAQVRAYLDAKYGVLPFFEPPARANLAHWFDTTDQSTVFSDAAGTIPITNGGTVRNIFNKGYVAVDVDDTAGQIPLIWNTNQVNGQSAMDTDQTGVADSSIFTPTIPGGFGATGFTMAYVGRSDDLSVLSFAFGFGAAPFAPKFSGSDADQSFGTTPPGNWFFTSFDDFWIADSGKPVVLGEWVYVIVTVDGPAGNWSIEGSGNFTISGTDPFTPAPGDYLVGFAGLADGKQTEALLWDRELTSPEITELKNYFTSRYGALPITPAIPAQGNLQNHWDFTDLSTLWQDAARTIPVAVNTDPIGYIDDKGTAPVDMDQATAIMQPVYDTVTFGQPSSLYTFQVPPNGDRMNSVGVTTSPGGNWSAAVIFAPTNLLVSQHQFGWGGTVGAGVWGFGIATNDWIPRFPPGGGYLGTPFVPLVNNTLYAGWISDTPAGSQRGKLNNTTGVKTSAVATNAPGAGLATALASIDPLQGSFDGHIFEVFVWDKTLTPTEEAEFELFVTSKYGITWA